MQLRVEVEWDLTKFKEDPGVLQSGYTFLHKDREVGRGLAETWKAAGHKVTVTQHKDNWKPPVKK